MPACWKAWSCHMIVSPCTAPSPAFAKAGDGNAISCLRYRRLLIVDSIPECFLRAAAKAGSASRSRSAADFLPFFGKAFNSSRPSSAFRFDGLWKPRSKLHPRRFGNADLSLGDPPGPGVVYR